MDRAGASVCAIASEAPYCAMFLFDLWQAGYAGIDNPGPDFVRGELAYVKISDATPGFALGPTFAATSQTRAAIETGFLF